MVLGRQQRYFEMPAVVTGILLWAAIAGSEGLLSGLKNIWILAIALWMGTWVLRMRLQVRGSRFEFAVLGPWRRAVDLESLESIWWKHTGAAASRGTMFVRDRQGGRIRIPVGRLSGVEVWGKMLLDAAARSGAPVDDVSRHVLEGGVVHRGHR